MPKKTDPQLGAARAALDKLAARRAEIAADRDAAAAALATAQGDLIDGEADAAEHVTTAQARVNGADGALAMLAERIAAAEATLGKLQQAADLERLERDAIDAARAAGLAREREGEAFGALADAVSSSVDEVRAARQDWSAARARFDSLTKSLADAGGPPRAAIERGLWDLDVSPAAVRMTGWNDPVAVDGVGLDTTVNTIIAARASRAQ